MAEISPIYIAQREMGNLQHGYQVGELGDLNLRGPHLGNRTINIFMDGGFGGVSSRWNWGHFFGATAGSFLGTTFNFLKVGLMSRFFGGNAWGGNALNAGWNTGAQYGAAGNLFGYGFNNGGYLASTIGTGRRITGLPSEYFGSGVINYGGVPTTTAKPADNAAKPEDNTPKPTEPTKKPAETTTKPAETTKKPVDNGDGVPSATYLTTLITGEAAGKVEPKEGNQGVASLNENVEDRKTWDDVHGTENKKTKLGNDDIKDAVKLGTAKGTNDANEKAEGDYPKYFTITDYRSHNEYSFQFVSSDDGKLKYKFIANESDLSKDDQNKYNNTNWELDASSDGTIYEVEIVNGEIILKNGSKTLAHTREQ